MHDHTAHKLLAQIPLTVSPFAGLPTAITLPYDYVSVPASLPPPSSNLVVSPSGQSSIPLDQLISDCKRLSSHLTAEAAKAKDDIDNWVKGIEQRELMEKRRVAPGWLDTGVLMLEPVKRGPGASGTPGPTGSANQEQKTLGTGEHSTGGKPAASPGEELDRAFGGMGI